MLGPVHPLADVRPDQGCKVALALLCSPGLGVRLPTDELARAYWADRPMTGAIATDGFSAQLRARGIDSHSREILITRFDGSQQEEDLAEPTNCTGLGRLRH